MSPHAAHPSLQDLSGMRLASDGIEVRRSRAEVKSRLFGNRPDALRLGRFVLLDRLGVGGMGVVYAAYDPQLDRKVALKLLRADRGGAESRGDALVEEARAMAKLSHPNVISVFEVGTVEAQVFIAMEYVAGWTLSGWLAADPRSPEEIVGVLRQAGLGLAAAHAHGLVHCDFKPGNVLVGKDESVRVTDFGLARRVGARSDIGPRFAGTPAYMAPEQLLRGEVDARSDQYSLCVTLLEALGVSLPEPDLDRLRTDPSYVPPAPSGATLDIGRRIKAALQQGLSADPDARHADVPHLLSALRPRRRRWVLPVFGLTALVVGGGVAWGAGMQTQQCTPSRAPLAGVWDDARRERVSRAFAAVQMPYAHDAWPRVETGLDRYADAWVDAATLACRVGGDGQAAAQRAACLKDRRRALSSTVSLLEDTDADTVEHTVGSVLELPPLSDCADPDRLRAQGVPGAPADPAAAADLAMARAAWRARRYEDGRAWARGARETAEAPTVVADARELEGKFALALADFDAAVDAFERALDLEAASAQQTAEAATGLAEATARRDTHEARSDLVMRAARIAVAAAGNPPRLRARLELALARLNYAAGRLDDGLAHARAGLSRLEEVSVGESVELADVLQTQGTLLYAKGRLNEAAEMSTRALELRRDLLGPTHPTVGESHGHLGAIALARGDTDEAIERFGLAEEVARRALGPGHPAAARMRANLGSARRVAGDMEAAREDTSAAMAALRETWGPDDPRVLVIAQNLASIEHELGHAQDAERGYRAVIDKQEVALGPDHPSVALTLANLGRVLLERGDFEGAREVVERALAIRVEALGADHPSTSRTKAVLAEVELAQGRRGRARTYLDEALAAQVEQLGDEHLDAVATRVVVGKVELEAGRLDLALQTFVDARAARASGGATPPDVAAVDVFLAQVHAAAGRTDASRVAAQRALQVLENAPAPADLRGWCEVRCIQALAAAPDGE